MYTHQHAILHSGPLTSRHRFCYASAFRRWRYYVFGLSVRPSEAQNTTCTWVRWFIRPIGTVLRHVRPSVRPYGAFSGHLKENAWRQWPETLRADVSWLDYCYGLLILLIFVLFWLNETGQIWGFRTFHGEPNEEMTWYIVYWCILITVRTD